MQSILTFFETHKDLFGIIFYISPVVSLLFWIIPRAMKTRILPILALLILVVLTMAPSDKIKVPSLNLGKIKSAFGGNSVNATSVNGVVGARTIQTIDESVRYRQVRPGRYNENDRWGYDNKYYRKVDRDYQLNMLDDLKLENKNVRGLLGRSKVDVNLYNKGLFNSGYSDVEVLIIAYDEYGDYLGERIEVMPHCICKSENSGERLGISRNTDEVIVKILHAKPCTCRDWYEKANRKRDKEQQRIDEEIKHEKEKQYKKWQRQNNKGNKNADRRRSYDRQPSASIQSNNRRSSNQSNTRKVVYYEDYEPLEDGYYYEEPKIKKRKVKKVRNQRQQRPQKEKGIPDDIRVTERGPLHVEFCDCRKCRYDSSTPNYEFSKKPY